jgi:endo-1,4-beta-xylanase
MNLKKLLKRRSFLLSILGLISIFSATAIKRFRYYSQVQALDNPKRDFSVVGDAFLRQRAAAKGLIYGAFAEGSYKPLSEEQELRTRYIEECELLVGGFYWNDTQPSENSFDFTDTDSFARFASDHSMLFRGHPLVFNDLVPKWLADKFKNPKTTSKEIQEILTNHVSTIVKRYAGQIHSWDVVNEAIKPDDGRDDDLRITPWLKFLGSDYIDIAFQTAAQADSKALLVYNDYGLEYDTVQDEAKRTAVLKMLQGMKSKGIPINALGLQSHLSASNHNKFNPQKLRSFLKDVASLDLKILITELDVADNELPADIATRDRMVASVYEDYLSAVLDEPAVIAVVTWGLSDRYTWLSQAAARGDRKPVRPLPFDSNLQPKLAWNAIARALSQAPKR